MIPLGEDRPAPIFPLVTHALIAANAIGFYFELTSASPDRFIAAFATIPYDIQHHIALAPPSPPDAYLTLLTSQFMHASTFHLVSNMLFLYVFGPKIEYACGGARFLAFYLICGVLGNVAQVTMTAGSHVPAIGASGAIAGVLGAFAVSFPTRPIFARIPAIFIIGIWAVTQFVHGLGTIAPDALSERGGGIAYFTHMGGFLAGVFLIGLFRSRVRRHYA
ncbi:MAG: rhomboid family intramembrane serine protease [Candidatus Eremiobacteraeota bacterium]|nr:rhomboid family intramembrane serine protease [Candidatus Eremiobacteraeota bacterium]